MKRMKRVSHRLIHMRIENVVCVWRGTCEWIICNAIWCVCQANVRWRGRAIVSNLLLLSTHLFEMHSRKRVGGENNKISLFPWITLDLHGIKMVETRWICMDGDYDHLHVIVSASQLVAFGRCVCNGKLFAKLAMKEKGDRKLGVFIWVLFAYFN